MSALKNPVRHIRHLLGLAALMDWLYRWRNTPDSFQLQGPLIRLEEEISQRFALGFPRRLQFGKNPVLLVQADEYDWMLHIKWARAHQTGNSLSLVSQRFIGIDDLPDLPAFALQIQLRGDASQLPFEQFRHLEMRKMWQEDDGSIEVEAGNPFQVVEWARSGAPLFAADDLKQGATFLEKAKERAMRGAREARPDYQGSKDFSKIPSEFKLQVSTIPSKDK